jgi:hypothetical protein
VPGPAALREKAAGTIAHYCEQCSAVIARDSDTGLLNAIVQQVR